MEKQQIHLNIHSERQIEEELHVSWYIVAYKLLYGVVEFLTGVGFAFFGKGILHFYMLQIHQELAEEPNDLLVRISERIVPNILTHSSFLSVYLIVLGIAKIIGAIGLYYKKTWGIDLLVGLTLIMLPFQLVNLITRPSLAEFLYVVIGLLIALYLINYKPQEWVKRVVKRIKS